MLKLVKERYVPMWRTGNSRACQDETKHLRSLLSRLISLVAIMSLGTASVLSLIFLHPWTNSKWEILSRSYKVMVSLAALLVHNGCTSPWTGLHPFLSVPVDIICLLSFHYRDVLLIYLHQRFSNKVFACPIYLHQLYAYHIIC